MNLRPHFIGCALALIWSSASLGAAPTPTEGRIVITDLAVQRAEGQRIAAEVRSLAPRASGTNTAERVPTTISTLPSRAASQLRARSACR